MTDDKRPFAPAGIVPLPTEQWTMLRLINPPEPNPHPMPDDLDEGVAAFVAGSTSPVRWWPDPTEDEWVAAFVAGSTSPVRRWPAPAEGTRDEH
ncbi:hypothetical protein C1J00_10005 [Streptomyces cahuitamycinicus]|uniref:Uncharacterized protein n=1 Tax=Streptomyces cahuitamycinicus TaxID=2070367 RepID=A0A2N8TTJ5_9ACTN|nr:hypothetical protein C1J00_10005 [Streptomyces cahuitamycinicus]